MVLNQNGVENAKLNDKLVGDLMEFYNAMTILQEVEKISEKGKTIPESPVFEAIDKKLAEVSKIKL